MSTTANIRLLIQNVQRRSSIGSAIELAYTSNENWPLVSTACPGRPLRVSVLDSSFNCPTLAHLALANAPRPPDFDSDGGDYDAKLLLLSVRNADKGLKPGDATFEQRIEMMMLMAKDVIMRNGRASTGANVAVGLIDEPTFVGKSDTLRKFLLSRLPGLPVQQNFTPKEVQLTFLLGFDTLERLFSPRYYTLPQPSNISAEANMLHVLRTFLSSSSSEGHNSRIVCARRLESSHKSTIGLPSSAKTTTPGLATGVDSTFWPLAFAGEFLESPKKIAIIDIEERLQAYSSSEVRKLVKEDDPRWKDMVPSQIVEYIEREQLYKAVASV